MQPEGGYTLVYEVATVTARHQLNCTVTHTPQGDSPIDCAHSSVEFSAGANKPARKATRYDLAREMRLIAGKPTQYPPLGA